MQQDDYDDEAYFTLLRTQTGKTTTVIARGYQGRHNDDSASIVAWFVNQYTRVITEFRSGAERSAETIGSAQVSMWSAAEVSTEMAASTSPRTRQIAVVRWGEHHSRHSLYGSALRVTSSGEVHLVNPLMPSGTTLQEWYSFTDYQALRDTPALPLLRHGGRYRIEPRVESVPERTTVFEVRFHDRFGDLVAAQVLYAPDHEFTYPGDGHSYTIRLVNAGCDQLRFTSLTLAEVLDQAEVLDSEVR